MVILVRGTLFVWLSANPSRQSCSSSIANAHGNQLTGTVAAAGSSAEAEEEHIAAREEDTAAGPVVDNTHLQPRHVVADCRPY